MNSLCIELISRVNTALSVAFGRIAAPLMRLPGWLSCTVIAAIVGLLILVIYKHTSNQKAILKIRNRIKANLLATRLYKDSLQVTLLAQWELLKAGFALLVHSLAPLLVMLLPMTIILAQLQAHYGYQPLAPGEETVVTVQLDSEESMSSVKIDSVSGAYIVTGPVKIQSLNQAVWTICADKTGQHKITFEVKDELFEKSLAIDNSQYPKVSPHRPASVLSDVMLYPLEKPFKADSPVQSVTIDYPLRTWETGITNSWLIDFFIISCLFALLFKKVVGVTF